MGTMHRSMAGLVAAMSAVLLLAGTVVAAAPANDDPSGATDVGIGSVIHQDTAGATTSNAERAINDGCGAPDIGHAVWFRFTADADGLVAFDTEDSEFTTGIAVFDGDPSSASVVACGPGRVTAAFSAGDSELLMVFGDGLSPATGGQLVLRVQRGIPAPEIELTVAGVGSVDKAGAAHVRGTARCTSQDGSGVLFELFGELSQQVGRRTISGELFLPLELACDGKVADWTTVVESDDGLFAGGKAATVAVGFGCTDECTEGYLERVIQLRRNAKH